MGRLQPNIRLTKIWLEFTMIEQVVKAKSSLLLKNIFQGTQTLQLFTKIIKTESIYKIY